MPSTFSAVFILPLNGIIWWKNGTLAYVLVQILQMYFLPT